MYTITQTMYVHSIMLVYISHVHSLCTFICYWCALSKCSMGSVLYLNIIMYWLKGSVYVLVKLHSMTIFRRRTTAYSLSHLLYIFWYNMMLKDKCMPKPNCYIAIAYLCLYAIQNDVCRNHIQYIDFFIRCLINSYVTSNSPKLKVSYCLVARVDDWLLTFL